MRVSLKNLIAATTGMNPVEFEAYCDNNQIQIEWLDVTLTDFNDGYYNVYLPNYAKGVMFIDGKLEEFN